MICTCGRGFVLKKLTDNPKIDSLCPKCLVASETPLKEEYTLEQLELAYEQDMNNSFMQDEDYYEVLNYG